MLDERAFEKAIGYEFSDKSLIRRACTHKSVQGVDNNERLEFLGDAVLELIVSESLYKETKLSEREMTTRRQRAVSDDALRLSAERSGLQAYLIFTGTDKDNLGAKPIASFMESVIGAIYLDGGYGKAKAFIKRFLTETDEKNYKGALQELAQSKGVPVPTYVLLRKVGKDHESVFTVQAELFGVTATGEGTGIKKAEQETAKNLLKKLQSKEK